MQEDYMLGVYGRRTSGPPPLGAPGHLKRAQVRCLEVLASGTRTVDGLRTELFSTRRQRIALSETRMLVAALAVLEANRLVIPAGAGAFKITGRGKQRLKELK